MWSGPRNVSTAFMRSWGNREDTLVVDEPFYAHYLDAPASITRAATRSSRRTSATGGASWPRCSAPVPEGVAILYQKQMAHHLLPHMGREWLGSMTHAFLIRDPRPMLASLGEKLGDFDLLATGLPAAGRDLRSRGAQHGAASRRSSTRPTCWPRRSPCCGRCARRSTFRSRPHAVVAAPARARPTACGRSTGTTAWSAPPVSSRRRDGAAPNVAGRLGRDRGALPAAVREAARAPRCAPEEATRAAEIRRAQPRPDRQRQRRLVAPRRGRREPVRLRRAGRRRRVGGAAALPTGASSGSSSTSTGWCSSAKALAFAADPDARGDHRRDPPHARGERHVRRRAHPPHADARREDHLRHGPAAEPVGPDADRARRAQAAGLRDGGSQPGHRAACGASRPTASTRRSTTTT